MQRYIKQSSNFFPPNLLVNGKNNAHTYNSIDQLHRSVGNQSVQKIFSSNAFQHGINIGAVNDQHEQHADQMANQVMNKSNDELNTSSMNSYISHSQKMGSNSSFAGGGRSLSKSERKFFEPRFNADFSQVRLHDNQSAAKSAKSINARAFTLGNNIVFGKNQYSSSSLSGKKLLAHELTHVVQQKTGASDPNTIQRKIELRPPGRGEASAFGRANEMVDRLNHISPALLYSLAADGRTLLYRIVFPSRVNNFDQQMMDFIDLPQVIPMRLITSAGTVRGFPIVGDSFLHGYVDLDDMMASDDLSFQSILVHFLQERAVTNRYEQRIGTPGLDSNTPAGERTFNRGHDAGHEAQAEHFRDVFNDISIVFNRARRRNNLGDVDIIFRSVTHNYRILLTLRRATTSSTGVRPRNLTGGIISVIHSGITYTVEDFLNTGPLAAILRPVARLNLPNLFGGRNLGFGLPPLTLGQGLTPPPSLLGLSPTPRLSPNFSSQLTPRSAAPQSNLQPILGGSFPTLSPNPSLIDWSPIRSELLGRGVPFNTQMQSSIERVWMNNYRFLSRVGFSRDQAVFWTNKTIPMAVGAGVNRDYPSLMEQMDREFNTSSIIFPVSDIFQFLISR